MKRVQLVVNNDVRNYYQNHSTFHEGDCGLDLFFVEETNIGPHETKLISLEIKCESLNSDGSPVSYYLYPRSSISKTPLKSESSTNTFADEFHCVPS